MNTQLDAATQPFFDTCSDRLDMFYHLSTASLIQNFEEPVLKSAIMLVRRSSRRPSPYPIPFLNAALCLGMHYKEILKAGRLLPKDRHKKLQLYLLQYAHLLGSQSPGDEMASEVPASCRMA